jgi:hypothetical protein
MIYMKGRSDLWDQLISYIVVNIYERISYITVDPLNDNFK